MNNEQDEHEEQMEEQGAEPQAEDMEIDDEDAPYLDLCDGSKHQAYAMLKRQSFGHTKVFDSDLLEETGMEIDFTHVWHAVGWTILCPSRMVLVFTPSSFFAIFEWKVKVFVSGFLGTYTILLGEI